MKTLSLFCCAFISLLGLITAFTSDFVAGSVLLFVGGISFLIIDYPTQKKTGYNAKHFMNR